MTFFFDEPVSIPPLAINIVLYGGLALLLGWGLFHLARMGFRILLHWAVPKKADTIGFANLARGQMERVIARNLFPVDWLIDLLAADLEQKHGHYKSNKASRLRHLLKILPPRKTYRPNPPYTAQEDADPPEDSHLADLRGRLDRKLRLSRIMRTIAPHDAGAYVQAFNGLGLDRFAVPVPYLQRNYPGLASFAITEQLSFYSLFSKAKDGEKPKLGPVTDRLSGYAPAHYREEKYRILIYCPPYKALHGQFMQGLLTAHVNRVEKYALASIQLPTDEGEEELTEDIAFCGVVFTCEPTSVAVMTDSSQRSAIIQFREKVNRTDDYTEMRRKLTGSVILNQTVNPDSNKMRTGTILATRIDRPEGDDTCSQPVAVPLICRTVQPDCKEDDTLKWMTMMNVQEDEALTARDLEIKVRNEIAANQPWNPNSRT